MMSVAFSAASVLLLALCVDAGPHAHALAPAPPSSPPPRSALEWAESAERHWVMVVDAGDGQRWLRALHKGAAASAVLWKMKTNRKDSAPLWLEGAPAYILASNDSNNILAAFNMAAVDVHHNLTYKRRLHIDSRARTVLSVSSSATFNNEMQTAGTYSQLLEALWIYQRSFLAIGVHEKPMGSDQLKDNSQQQTWDQFYRDNPLERSKEKLHFLPALFSPEEISSRLERWFTNLHGHPLRIAWTSAEFREIMKDLRRRFGYHDITMGTDLRLLVEVGRSINSINTETSIMAFRRHTRRMGLSQKQSENFGAQLISRGEMDVSTRRYPLGEGHALPTRFRILPSTYETWNLIMVVPCAQPYPLWSLPLRALGVDVWLAVAASVAAYAVSWRLVTGEPLFRSLCAALCAFSSYGGTAQERVSATHHRILLGAALLVSTTVLTTIYQSRQFAITTKPEYRRQMKSVRDLAEARIPLKCLLNVHRIKVKQWASGAFAGEDVYARHIAESAQVQHFDLAGLDPRWAHTLMKYQWFHQRVLYPGRQVHHIPLKEFNIPVPSVIVTSRNFPWREVINERVLRAEGAGLIAHWSERTLREIRPDYQNYVGNKKETSAKWTSEDEPRVLALGDLWPHFQVLAIGNLFAVATCIYEVWKGRRERKQARAAASRCTPAAQ